MPRTLLLLLYYGLLQHIPMQPFPGFRIGYALRRQVLSRLLARCGQDIVVKSRCYVGNGSRLSVGSRSQLGQNARLNGQITIGDDVMMGPDVVMMSTSHDHRDVTLPMNSSPNPLDNPIILGDDIWVGTRAIILPGVEIGSHSIIGAGAVVSKSFPPYSVVGGVPARRIKDRRTASSLSDQS